MNKKEYFGSCNDSNNKLLAEYINKLDEHVKTKYEPGNVFYKGTYDTKFYEYLKTKSLNENELTLDETMKYISNYFSNTPVYNNPGTMINVISSVNVMSMSAAAVASMLNPNFAQDTYSGDLILSELEVAKYISEMIGWNWEKSYGFFTFGGTGTNLYGNKLALINADPESKEFGVTKDKYFMVTSKNGHPCHYQLCDWLGIGTNSCIEIECNDKGEIDITNLESVICSNIEKGKTFIGYNLNGGSTNEMTIDPIKKVYDLNKKIVSKYNLNYIPHIHVDAVLGWVFLFFKDYNPAKNKLELSNNTLDIINSLANKISELKYADTVGIDFHKTGFCPYVSSMILTKDKKKFDMLNPEKSVSLLDMNYGDYNPFQIALEYSRGAHGPISALTTLKSLGKNGFRQIIGQMMENAVYFRNKLSKLNNVLIVFPETEGLATMFLILPEQYSECNVEDIKQMDQTDLEKIKKYNLEFGKYILNMAVTGKNSFFFTSSRSYMLPNTTIKVGVLKAYPMSVFLDKSIIDNIVIDIKNNIAKFNSIYLKVDNYDYCIKNLFNEMSKDAKME